MVAKTTKPKEHAPSPNGQPPEPGTPGQQARAARKQQLLASAARRRRRQRLAGWGGGVLVVAVAGMVAWLALRADDENGSGAGGLPGPEGGEHVAQDVNTMVGMPAPAFTLIDSEGASYGVTPGQGRPIVLVFHMGIT